MSNIAILKIMDLREQVTKLVEKELENVIQHKLKNKVKDENSFFDIKALADELFEKYFPEKEIENLKNKIFNNGFQNGLCRSESDDSSLIDSFQDNLETEVSEFPNLYGKKIVNDLLSNSIIRLKCLKDLEVYLDEVINDSSWNIIKKILLKFLKEKFNREIYILSLKVTFSCFLSET